ncbi:MAG: PEP/pyruvate-binding domain-containing protein [Gemmatimonadaceae bacterium]
MVIWPHDGADAATLGGKAGALASLRRSGVAIPAWFVVAPGAGAVAGWEETVVAAVRQLAPNGEPVAVRSSAAGEDGVEHSYAGQLESYLFVAAADVPARVRDVWTSVESARVAAYRIERRITGSSAPAVLVQRMVNAERSGVAFSADPVTGRRGRCVVAAVFGLGTALVSGADDADSLVVERAGTIVERRTATKSVAHRRNPAGDVVEVPLTADDATRPVLSDNEARAVAALARRSALHFGAPQDIEWAIEDDELYLLQSRPITSLAALGDPDGVAALWDNSNIAESYGGVTTPLTYSFARYVYEEVYRQFLSIVGVPAETIDANGDSLRRMIGLVRGRVYYNLYSWYRALALLPGFRLNQRFMEQMMGVRDGLPESLAAELASSSRGARWGDALGVARMGWRLVAANLRIDSSVREFHERLERALAGEGVPLSDMRPDEIVAHYRRLERELLRNWDAPLLNDFFAMIHFGALRKLAAKWCGDAAGTLQNDLVAGDGSIVSAEPARRIREMGLLAAADPAAIEQLTSGNVDAALAAVRRNPALAERYDDYLARFGDRCLDELKLETETLDDDPSLLLDAIGRAAASKATATATERADFRADAERRAFAALRGRPVRRWLFGKILRQARGRVRDRENLRFERTRVFGRVRRIFLELGKHFATLGLIDAPRDVFYLEVNEALGAVEGTATSINLRALVEARRSEFEKYSATAAPPDRFVTRGMVHQGKQWEQQAASAAMPIEGGGGELRTGTGCYPGVVRGAVRVVRDPRDAGLRPGEILVAERTDPGWVMLFPAASALLVERGSLLSHSAIVARELGIPAVVSIGGLTQWLKTGDVVEMDGRAGTVRRVGAATERKADDAA